MKTKQYYLVFQFLEQRMANISVYRHIGCQTAVLCSHTLINSSYYIEDLAQEDKYGLQFVCFSCSHLKCNLLRVFPKPHRNCNSAQCLQCSDDNPVPKKRIMCKVISWDEFFMKVAEAAAMRSKDPKQVPVSKILTIEFFQLDIMEHLTLLTTEILYGEHLLIQLKISIAM